MTLGVFQRGNKHAILDQSKAESKNMFTSPDEKVLQSLLRDIDIPACPDILVELDAELRKEEFDQRAVARLISRDVALSGQIMQIANSPAFSTGRPVDSIMQALAILGVRQVFNLIVMQMLKLALAENPDLDMDHFWESSANTARVSAELARRLRCVKPELAYTFGLFHDCGIPLVMKRFTNYREALALASAAGDRKFTRVEDEHVGTNHAVVGYFLARRWKLPDFAAQGILLHHDYEVLDDASQVSSETRSVIALSVFAEHLTRLHSHLGEESEWLKAAHHVAFHLGKTDDELEDLAEDMLEWLEACEQAK